MSKCACDEDIANLLEKQPSVSDQDVVSFLTAGGVNVNLEDGKQRRCALDSLAVPKARAGAELFAKELTSVLNRETGRVVEERDTQRQPSRPVQAAAGAASRILLAVPFTAETYIDAILGTQPVLFSESPSAHRRGLTLDRLLRRGSNGNNGVQTDSVTSTSTKSAMDGGDNAVCMDAATTKRTEANRSNDTRDVSISVRWSQEALESVEGELPLSCFRLYFDENSLLRPPTVIDMDLETWTDDEADFDISYELPPVVAATTLMTGTSCCALFHKPDIILSPPNAVTAFHTDMGFAGWLDMAEGVKDWAICSWQDGEHLADNPPSSVADFLTLPSARICRVREGQSLFVPCGDVHFVVTREASVAVSHDLFTVGCVDRARAFYAGHAPTSSDAPPSADGSYFLESALSEHQSHGEDVTYQTLVAARCGVSEVKAREYCKRLHELEVNTIAAV